MYRGSAIMSHVQQQSSAGASSWGRIQPGMPVFDKEFVKIGTIAQRTQDTKTLFETDLIVVIPKYLRALGFIEVASGLVSGNYFVMPQQVVDLTEDGVFLSAHRNSLIQF